MEIRRSEVWFCSSGHTHRSAQDEAIHMDRVYYVLLDAKRELVFGAITGKRICKVSDLIDDRPSPFPPLQAEVSSDTATDQARDAALRDCIK